MGGKGTGSRRVSVSAVLGGLSLLTLGLACLVPTGKVGLTALAGLFPAAAVVSFGFPAGGLCYAGSGLLALLLLSDKALALLYLLFFGLYPIVKGLIERLRLLPVEWVLKLLIFNGVLTLLLLAGRQLFYAVMPVGRLPLSGLYPLANGVFFVYDIGLSKLIGLYSRRVDRML